MVVACFCEGLKHRRKLRVEVFASFDSLDGLVHFVEVAFEKLLVNLF